MFKLLKRAPGRFRKSFGYSWDGFKSTFHNEESFRLELLAFSCLLAVMFLCGWPLWKAAAMSASFLLIILTELLNTAIEDVCNLITREKNELVKSAKDKGAMAVLIAIIVNALVLTALLLV